MPYKCCVPKCRGNYKGEPKVSAFSFPKEEQLRRKWIDAIKRDVNFIPSAATKVCELHFCPGEVERITSVYDETTQRLLIAPLEKPRLITGAIPRKFPGCLKYSSHSQNLTQRGSPEPKKLKIDSAALQKAISESPLTAEVYAEDHLLLTLDDKLHFS